MPPPAHSPGRGGKPAKNQTHQQKHNIPPAAGTRSAKGQSVAAAGAAEAAAAAIQIAPGFGTEATEQSVQATLQLIRLRVRRYRHGLPGDSTEVNAAYGSGALREAMLYPCKSGA